MLWAALVTAFFFLLRSSEYSAQFPGQVIDRKGLRGVDVTPKLEGVPVDSLELADEVVLKIRGSKTDQLNRGEWRNHFRSVDRELCPVQALAYYQHHAPERFRGSEAADWLFVWADGTPLLRDQIQAHLQNMAEECGLDRDEYASHSLRFGGASALWNAFRDSGMVQRWGRWASQCYQGYVWEARDAAKDVSTRMAEADFNLV